MGNASARLIAYYLPQFHPTPENDEWWGKGFTEWTNTAKAKPMFRGHYQPHVPADLGFYDLRVPETRVAQADLAREYGVEAFCYYHYWFAGRRILERPFSEVLASGEPDFPFCLCWANQTWTGVWHGEPKRVLIEQTYPGEQDHRTHFEYLLQAFRDPRYVRVEGKPLFVFYRPLEIPAMKAVSELWRKMAVEAGLPGLYLVGVRGAPIGRTADLGLDASTTTALPQIRPWVSKRTPVKWFLRHYHEKAGKPTIYDYESVLDQLLPPPAPDEQDHPCLFPNWDNTPRSGRNGLVLHGSTPDLFRIHARRGLELVRDKDPEHALIFVKSWNEWAEGNHIEPDLRFGHRYLEVLRDVFARNHERGRSG